MVWWVRLEEQYTPLRPYRIYWHGMFLRNYDNLTDFENNLKFFTGFLLNMATSLHTED